nr:splicing factor [Tanacetum cinerariifolium]
QVFTDNLHHDGIFSPSLLKYIQGDEKQITDINIKGIRELKTVKEFIRLGVISSGSSDEYYNSDECEEIEGVDFHTKGEENVVIKNLSTQDPFLNRLCTNSGLFRVFVDVPVPQTEGDDLKDPDDAN